MADVMTPAPPVVRKRGSGLKYHGKIGYAGSIACHLLSVKNGIFKHVLVLYPAYRRAGKSAYPGSRVWFRTTRNRNYN